MNFDIQDRSDGAADDIIKRKNTSVRINGMYATPEASAQYRARLGFGEGFGRPFA